MNLPVKKEHSGKLKIRKSIGKVEIPPPNSEAREYAEEKFGSYELYIAEVRRFIEEDMPRLVDMIGPPPVYYEFSMNVGLLAERYRAEYKSKKRLGRNIDNLVGTEICKNIPKIITTIYYVRGGEFWIDEKDFSFRIYGNFAPILLLHQDGIFDFSENSAIDHKENKFGSLADDPILYLSLVELINSEPDPKIVQFQGKRGYVRFIKGNTQIGMDASGYLEQYHPDVLVEESRRLPAP